MTTQEMVDLVRDRSRQRDTAKICRELRAAFRWSMNRVYLTEGGPDLLSAAAQETTLAADTKTTNLAQFFASDTILGLKALWAKMPTDTTFQPLIERDLEDPVFQALDNESAASPTVASNHPVLFHISNFTQVRFANSLPAGTVLRVDYFKYGSAPDPTTNPDPNTVGSDLTYLFHDAIVCKASAHCLENLDDDRVGSWETRAMVYLNDAVLVAQKRIQGPVAHRGWRSRGRALFG